MEDSLSDLYAHSQCELGKRLTPEIEDFLGIVKEEEQLMQIIDKEQLRRKSDEKEGVRRSEIQLIPLDENGRISNRYQADILQTQNNELNRQIQKNRARTITRQNNIKSSLSDVKSPFSRVQNIVDKINIYTQEKEAKQEQKQE